MFVPNILTFASEGRELQYAGIGCPIDKWGPWFADEERKHGTLEDVEHNYVSLMTPERLLDIYRFYSVFTGTSGGRKLKLYVVTNNIWVAKLLFNVFCQHI